MFWTSRVRRLHPSHLDPMPEGFVPTSYIEASKATTQSYFNTLLTLFRWQRCLRLLKSCEQRKEARCRNEAELESELQDIFMSSSFFLQLDWGMQVTLLWRLWRIYDKCWNIQQVQSKTTWSIVYAVKFMTLLIWPFALLMGQRRCSSPQDFMLHNCCFYTRAIHSHDQWWHNRVAKLMHCEHKH